MSDTTNEIPVRSLSVQEMQRREMLCRNIDLPKNFAQLTTREQSCLLGAGTRLFTTDSSIFPLQRSLFLAMAMTALCPRLRDYCVALIDLSDDEWDYFSLHYTVPLNGGPKLARAATAYAALFPHEY